MIKRLFILAIILYNTAIFAQDNENPYAIFGYEPKISDTTYSEAELFYLHNSDTKAFVQTLAFDFENGKVYLYDDNNLLLATILLEKEDMARFTTPDPLAEKYPNVSPYAYCMNNPIRFIDPDGRDWIVADGTIDYQWLDDINAKSKLPKGYTYVGANNSDILSHMGMNYKLPELNTRDVGMVAADAELGKYAVSHLVGVKEKSNATISANVSNDKDNATANNVLGKTFNGISVNVTEVSSNSGVDGNMIGGGFVSAQYGNKTYEAVLKSPDYTYYHATGTTVTEANINIPKSELAVGTKFSQIQVKGNWFVKKPEGITPVVRHSLIPYPISFKHTWTFK